MISVFATALLENRSPTIYGDGGQTRDFTYVANVVDGVLRACEAPRRERRGHQRRHRRTDLAERAVSRDEEDRGATVEPTYAASRQGDVRDSQADIRKAKEILGYEPTVSFEDGLRRTIEWYRTTHTAVGA